MKLTRTELLQLQNLLHKALLESSDYKDHYDLCVLYGLDMKSAKSVAHSVGASITEKIYGMSNFIDHRVANSK